MALKKKFRLKPPAIKALKIIGTILIIILLIFIFYRSNINDLTKLGYSEKSAKTILLKLKKKDVIEIGKSKTLNAAFESEDYNEKYFNNYAKIKYQNQKHIIKNINKLIKLDYNNEQISIILAHGNDEDITSFTKLKKVRYLEEFFNLDYAKLKYYDRYLAYMNNSREDEETSVLYVNLDIDKEDYVDAQKVEKFNYAMLVNKHHQLNDKFIPNSLISISKEYASEKGIKANSSAVASAKKMIDAAKKENYNLIINSAYRSYDDQEKIVNTYKELYGDSYVERYVLKAGFSEHQTGLGFDFGSTDTKVFSTSDEYKWMQDNCYKYGFIQRFSPAYEDITEIKSEAWHYRYVGKKVAKYIYENEITLEEYYVKFLDKN